MRSTQRELAIVERIDRRAHERDRADDLVVQQHRRGDDRAEPHDLLHVLPSVLGVVENVRDLLDLPIVGDPAQE